ncbi:hypothetical protein QC763_105028 [Podospora pseudopauciseta]|uniref:Uncharacterized protein n=1 Tax=Podospora pseudopauciseta TaxID=2093780 RepID=A0ABR0HX41_9PEZI|nr:hypothetical protein QC763_105028 [Podospora pseudopauciseta]
MLFHENDQSWVVGLETSTIAHGKYLTMYIEEIKMTHPKNSTDQHTNELWISMLEESTFEKDEIDADECYDSSQTWTNRTGGDLSEDIGTPL